MSIDSTVDVKNQSLQGGDDWEVSGKHNIDVTNGGQLLLDGVQQPLKCSFSPAAGVANQCLVSVQLSDGSGAAITYPAEMTLYLSDAATGAGITAVTASGTVAAGASGVDLGDLTSKKVKVVQTTTAGLYILAINDTAKTGFFVCAYIGDQAKPFVSAQLVTGNYG